MITTNTGISASSVKIGVILVARATAVNFAGKIDGVRIYSTALTASEVSGLYEVGM